MAQEIIMPKLGMGMEEGTVVEWRKEKAEEIKQGETVVVISSEKIEMEVESPADGVLVDIAVPEGEIVPIGTVIGYVGQAGEQIEATSPAETNPVKTNSELTTTAEEVASTVLAPDKQEKKTSASSATSESTSTKVVKSKNNRMSPVARKLAREAGIDIEQIEGTGPRGRITKADVEKAIQEQSVEQSIEESTEKAAESLQTNHRAGTKTLAEMSTSQDLGVSQGTVKPLAGIRKVIAERMQSSLQQSAQLTLNIKVDVTDLIHIQKSMAQDIQDQYETKLTLTTFISRATILALLKHKQMNSAYIDNQIHTYEQVHLGMAVALENGLVVPVIQHAEKYSLIELSKQIQVLSAKARNGELEHHQMKGSTFTITNLGSYGIESFTPILNPPETGILGIGATEDTPIYIGEELKRRSLLPLSLTFDHRILDGAPAAQFLHDVKHYLHKPNHMFVL